MPLGESPDEDVAKPELSVKVTKTDLWIKTEIFLWVKLRFGQHDLLVDLVVLPTSHEVLVGLNIIPHLQRTPSSTSAC